MGPGSYTLLWAKHPESDACGPELAREETP